MAHYSLCKVYNVVCNLPSRLQLHVCHVYHVHHSASQCITVHHSASHDTRCGRRLGRLQTTCMFTYFTQRVVCNQILTTLIELGSLAAINFVPIFGKKKRKQISGHTHMHRYKRVSPVPCVSCLYSTK